MTLSYSDRLLTLAHQAYDQEEVPVAALIVQGDKVIAAAHNEVEQRHDPCAHAEILALREASQRLKNHRLLEAEMLVSVEPCLMCWAACVHARLLKVTFFSLQPKWGAPISYLAQNPTVYGNHQPKIECIPDPRHASLLQKFFQERRDR